MTVYEKGYTKEELEQTVSETNRQFVEKLKEKRVQILENNDKIEKNISGYRISGNAVKGTCFRKQISAAQSASLFLKLKEIKQTDECN